MSRVPKFKPRRSVNVEIQTDLLRNDDFGRYLHETIADLYNGPDTRSGICMPSIEHTKRGDPFEGSSIFWHFAIDEQLRKMSYGSVRVLQPQESELLLALGYGPSKGEARDLGVVMDFSRNNHNLALILYEMLPKEYRDLDRFPAILSRLVTRIRNSTNPYYIGRKFLTLEPSDDYPLSFTTAKILDDGRIRGAGGNSIKFKADDQNLIREGVPSAKTTDENNTRSLFVPDLYTNGKKERSVDQLGISRFYLANYDNDLSLIAKDDTISYEHNHPITLLKECGGENYQKLLQLAAAGIGKARDTYLSELKKIRNKIDKKI